MKHSLSVQVWIRCVIGVAVFLGIAAIATDSSGKRVA
jgi:hypothetical protein